MKGVGTVWPGVYYYSAGRRQLTSSCKPSDTTKGRTYLEPSKSLPASPRSKSAIERNRQMNRGAWRTRWRKAGKWTIRLPLITCTERNDQPTPSQRSVSHNVKSLSFKTIHLKPSKGISCYCRSTQIPDNRSQGRLTFVQWRLTGVSPLCLTCFTSTFWRLDWWLLGVR
jgi:hypothetical protein